MSTRLGIQIQVPTDKKGMARFINEKRPPYIKHIDPQDDFLDLLDPDLYHTVRLWWDASSQDVDNPGAAAERIIKRVRIWAREGLVKAVEGYNEVSGGHGWTPGTDSTEHLRRFLLCDAEMGRIIEGELGISYIGGNWSVGCPSDIDLWTVPAMTEWAGKLKAIGLHEYNAPHLWQNESFDPRLHLDDATPALIAARREMYLSSGWCVLRYRKVYAKLELMQDQGRLATIPEFHITEVGIDSGAPNGKWPVFAQGGWRSFLRADEYMAELAWQDRQWLMDDYVNGAAIFLMGGNQDWVSHDAWRDGRFMELYGQYLLDHRDLTGEELEAELAREAQKHVIPYVPGNAFRLIAQAQGWDEAMSDEFEWRGYRAQVYLDKSGAVPVQRIVYAPVDKWDQWQVIEREN